MGSDNTPSNVRPADELRDSPRPPGAREQPPAGEGRTLRRGLLLLDRLQRAGDAGLRVVELCRASGLQRATVHRLLATLLDTGHVQRSGRFHYVAAVRREPQGAGALDLARRIAPVLARVSKACGDAAFAVVREGHSSWCIARHVGTYPVQILSVQVGARQPLGVGAAGLALLAALSDDEAQAAIHAHGVVADHRPAAFARVAHQQFQALGRRPRGLRRRGPAAGRHQRGREHRAHDEPPAAVDRGVDEGGVGRLGVKRWPERRPSG